MRVFIAIIFGSLNQKGKFGWGTRDSKASFIFSFSRVSYIYIYIYIYVTTNIMKLQIEQPL
jgi:hypothetical protein